jgi:hypothetical protein
MHVVRLASATSYQSTIHNPVATSGLANLYSVKFPANPYLLIINDHLLTQFDAIWHRQSLHNLWPNRKVKKNSQFLVHKLETFCNKLCSVWCTPTPVESRNRFPSMLHELNGLETRHHICPANRKVFCGFGLFHLQMGFTVWNFASHTG